jgi:glycosyltransferase involved in cell wall biosynthesis
MNVLTLIKTTGLDYDDRLRKEALALCSLGAHVEIVAVEYANQTARKMVFGDVPAYTCHLRSRNWFVRETGLLAKTIEMYLCFLAEVIKRKPDILWFHNLELSGLVPLLVPIKRLGHIRRLVWDQHELPPDSVLGNSLLMKLFSWLTNGCDFIVMANEDRRDFMMQTAHHAWRTPVIVLSNYPDEVFLQWPRMELPTAITAWLQGDGYLLAQGGANPKRHLEELVEATMKIYGLRLIVVGPHRPEQLDRLRQRFSTDLDERVLFTGFVPQMEIVPFIDHALASVVFYSVSVTNSYLCAPNRLYQALGRGIPVIVSTNPPMRRVVEQFECGVVVDARDPDSIEHGIEKMLDRKGFFSDQAAACSNMFVWEAQSSRLKSLLED